MKKLIIAIFATFISFLSFSQEATEKGNFLFELGTTAFGERLIKQGAATGLNFQSVEGSTEFSIGAEGGYFVRDNTAVKIGLGYSDLQFSNIFTYKLGLKHYLKGNIPLQLDITGATKNDEDKGFGFATEDTPDPLWLGLQAGYAVFLADNISFEPTLRYNASLNKDYPEETIFELRFNFVFFF